jgi:hypothetical protein
MYVTHITLPVVFAADSDTEARAIVEMLRTHLADTSFAKLLSDDTAWEISDYPDATLQEVLPYVEPRPVTLDPSEVAALADEAAMESEIHLWSPFAIADREAAARRHHLWHATQGTYVCVRCGQFSRNATPCTTPEGSRS